MQIDSYLNNNGIDQLKPTPRRKRVSSLSLSDQWAGSSGLGLSTYSEDAEKMKSIPIKPNCSFTSPLTKMKKDIIDHPRVASYAFAFDIDGVLVRGPETIPQAPEAIRYLNGENPYNIKVPYIFVTNGGGKAESVRAEDLTKRLECEVNCDQVVQGHTPMKDLSSKFKNVLVVGGVGEVCRKIAIDYGYENVYTPLDIINWDPSVTPYYTLTEEDKEHCIKNVDFSEISFDAILVFADSRNWAADEQIILELLMSKNGVMGTISDNFEDGPPIYFAHSDFVWSTNYKLVRYGMGALQVSIAALFREHTGKEMKVIRFGKPQRGTWKFADKVLKEWRRDVLDDHVSEIKSSSTELFSKASDSVFLTDSEGEDDAHKDDDDEDDGLLTIQGLSKLNIGKSQITTNDKVDPITNANISKLGNINAKTGLLDTVNEYGVGEADNLPPPSTVYFVGDTPESDIRFANSHDESWFSILVKTGVYQEDTIPKYMPKKTVENVLDAVKFAVEREHEKELAEWNASAV